MIDLSQNNPTYPKLDRIRNITGKLAELWSMHPNSTFIELLEMVTGCCTRDECMRLMTDADMESMIDKRLVELLGK